MLVESSEEDVSAMMQGLAVDDILRLESPDHRAIHKADRREMMIMRSEVGHETVIAQTEPPLDRKLQVRLECEVPASQIADRQLPVISAADDPRKLSADSGAAMNAILEEILPQDFLGIGIKHDERAPIHASGILQSDGDCPGLQIISRSRSDPVCPLKCVFKRSVSMIQEIQISVVCSEHKMLADQYWA